MWPKVHDKLKGYTPLMIGLGAIIIGIDGIVFLLHRFAGLDKGMALYFSIVLLVSISYLAIHRQSSVYPARKDNFNRENPPKRSARE